MNTWIITGLILITSAIQMQMPTIYLNPSEYKVKVSPKYQSLRLRLINNSDTEILITRLDQSCGCILATVQNNKAVKGKPGEIYIGVNAETMDTLQPISIDLITIPPQSKPLRFLLRKEIKKLEKTHE